MKIILKPEENLKNLDKLKQRLQPGEIDQLLEEIGIYMEASVRRNFYQAGRPEKWQSLKPATKKRKRGPGILIESGALLEGIAHEIHTPERAVEIGPTGESLSYALRHNYGDISNRPIPQRQYLIIQEEDREYLEAFTRAYIY